MFKAIIGAALLVVLSTPASAQYRNRGFDIGDLIGGVIGGILFPPYQPYQPYYPAPYQPPYDPYAGNDAQAVRYCMMRFRSYNPQTGLFIGYDGRYHPCP
jgi:BA14K-like protein